MSSKPLIILQLNEVNLDLVRQYPESDLPRWHSLLQRFESSRTGSEDQYEHLEPWIQWYSFYTGLPYKDHKVFNLGDCLKQPFPGLAKNYFDGNRSASFAAMNMPPSDLFDIYIPDPWTASEAQGSSADNHVAKALRLLVNSNAGMKIEPASLIGAVHLAFSALNKRSPKVFPKILMAALKRNRAQLSAYFDYLFFCYSMKRIKSADITRSMVFLNGIAHVQHHYMLSSAHVPGGNPQEYVPEGKDPLFECLKAYEPLIALILDSSNKFRFEIITGLTQEPYKNPENYWRFADHKSVICEANGFPGVVEIHPRMTRDFEIEVSPGQTEMMKSIIESATVRENDGNETMAFSNVQITSDKTIFCTFAYAGEKDTVNLCSNGREYNLKGKLYFVARKNGGHVEYGYWLSQEQSADCKIWDVLPKLSSNPL